MCAKRAPLRSRNLLIFHDRPDTGPHRPQQQINGLAPGGVKPSDTAALQPIDFHDTATGWGVKPFESRHLRCPRGARGRHPTRGRGDVAEVPGARCPVPATPSPACRAARTPGSRPPSDRPLGSPTTRRPPGPGPPTQPVGAAPAGRSAARSWTRPSPTCGPLSPSRSSTASSGTARMTSTRPLRRGAPCLCRAVGLVARRGASAGSAAGPPIEPRPRRGDRTPVSRLGAFFCTGSCAALRAGLPRGDEGLAVFLRPLGDLRLLVAQRLDGCQAQAAPRRLPFLCGCPAARAMARRWWATRRARPQRWSSPFVSLCRHRTARFLATATAAI